MEIRIKVEGPRWLKSPKRRSTKLGLALLVALAVAVPVAWANHTFADVPAASPHHADVSTIARAEITLGCNPPFNTLYCPADFVRRDQMGSFIARTLRVLTPVIREASVVTGALDIDPGPVICPTTAFTPSVAAAANIQSTVSAIPVNIPIFGELLNFTMENVVSTNGGVTWNGLSGAFARAGSDDSALWTNAAQVDATTLNAGTSYRFGIRVDRDSGNADFADGRCQLTATLTYRDAGASSLGAAAEVATAGNASETR